jgi:hypothetical protein
VLLTVCIHKINKSSLVIYDSGDEKVKHIDLVIDPQSVGKRTHDLMDTVNAKKRWKTI